MSILINYNLNLKCKIIYILNIYNKSLESLNPFINYFMIYAGRVDKNFFFF
jgi:hypothetical protein